MFSIEQLVEGFQAWAAHFAPSRSNADQFNEVWIDFWLQDIRGLRDPALPDRVLEFLRDDGPNMGRGRKKKAVLTDDDIFGMEHSPEINRPIAQPLTLTDDDLFGVPEIIVEDVFGSPDLSDDDIFGEEGGEVKARIRNAKGKPAGSSLLRGLSRDTTQGKLIAYCLNESRTVDGATEEFYLPRNAVMSTLNSVAKKTGIGYSVNGDTITLILPPGVTNPFAADIPDQLRKKKGRW